MSAIIDRESLIRGLNPEQRKGNFRSPAICAGLLPWFIAVEHAPDIPLQILAGPGSGKTKVSSGKRAYTVFWYHIHPLKVLTSRIARLILVHGIAPTSICAVTFTKKAATEMRDRLLRLIGKEKTLALQMGTFHSLCARFLRKYYHAVKLEENFTICDADETWACANSQRLPCWPLNLVKNWSPHWPSHIKNI